MSFEWPHTKSAVDGALAKRFSGASQSVLDALHDAGDVIARQRDVGTEYAHAVTDELLTTAQRAGRSMRHVVEEKPAQSLLIVGAAAFVAGWALRRIQELRMARESEELAASAQRAGRPRTSAAGRKTS